MGLDSTVIADALQIFVVGKGNGDACSARDVHAHTSGHWA